MVQDNEVVIRDRKQVTLERENIQGVRVHRADRDNLQMLGYLEIPMVDDYAILFLKIISKYQSHNTNFTLDQDVYPDGWGFLGLIIGENLVTNILHQNSME